VCPSPFEHAYVSLAGDVSPCVQLQFRGIYMGSLQHTALGDVFASRGYEFLRQIFANGDVPAVCVGCPAIGGGRA